MDPCLPIRNTMKLSSGRWQKRVRDLTEMKLSLPVDSHQVAPRAKSSTNSKSPALLPGILLFRKTKMKAFINFQMSILCFISDSLKSQKPPVQAPGCDSRPARLMHPGAVLHLNPFAKNICVKLKRRWA